MTAMFLVQSPVSLGFKFLFRVFLDLDLGAPEHREKVSMELSPWLPLPSVAQNPIVGGNLDKFVSVKYRNLHAGQVDDKLACSEPTTLLGMQAVSLRQSSQCQQVLLTSLLWSS